MRTVELVVHRNRLAVLHDPVPHCLVYQYPSGDCDMFHWPLDLSFRSREKQLKQMCGALYDLREMGYVPSDCKEAKLPDGTTILIDDVEALTAYASETLGFEPEDI